jgi:hypothetical protein
MSEFIAALLENRAIAPMVFNGSCNTLLFVMTPKKWTSEGETIL